MQAMILAAGFGTRLRPLTEHLPKALFPVLNRPLLSRLLEQLKDAGCGRVLINTHHLAPAIIAALSTWRFPIPVTPLVETCLLGTGGALRNALPYLDPKEPLLVMNGDVVTDLDLRRIWLAHKDRPCLGTLVIHHRSPWNKVAVDGEVIRGFRDKGPGALAFTGISVLDPSLLEWIPPDRPSSLIETFDAVMAARGNALRALRVEGLGRTYVWEDIGTVEGYLAAHARFLSVSANRFLISPNVDVPSDLRLQEWACIGSGAHLGPGVTLRRSVVWEKTEVRADTTLEDSAVTLHGILKIRRLDA